MRSAFIAAACALLLIPAGAAAQSSPFAPLPQTPPQQPQQPVPFDDGSQDDGLSGRGAALIVGGGLLFVLGVAVAIAVDARRNAPTGPRRGRPGDPNPRGDDEVEGLPGERKKRDRRQQEKQKATAKRARQARKKNRPIRK
ncbi:MAG: hypothetical protein H0V81_17030 [Solirubrobacterales bacterium]|nr:hypothetical protein [Solirubrobacterales bacterium]